MNAIYEAYYDLVRDLQQNIDSPDHTIKRAYLGVEDNRLGIPPGAGYYLGENIVLALIRQGYTLKEMIHWNAPTVRRRMLSVLPRLDRDS